jgi:hypothetical protein
MPDLVLLNGPPASGKSTLAAAWIASRPLALALDIDLVRGQLGRWRDEPTASGLAARALALSMIHVHLRAGHDVVVPQLVALYDRLQTFLATRPAVRRYGVTGGRPSARKMPLVGVDPSSRSAARMTAAAV